MAKGTRYGGASLTKAESLDPESPQPVRVRRAEIGYVDREVTSSVGMDSSRHFGRGKSVSVSESQSLPQPAHTTENLSDQPEQETDSTAPSMATVGRNRTVRPSARRARVTPEIEIVEIDEFDDFD